MLPEMKLVIFHNDKVIHTVTKQLSEYGLVKSITDFQVIANSTMTKMIDDSGDSAGELIIEEEVDDSDNEEEDVCVSPKKRKK